MKSKKDGCCIFVYVYLYISFKMFLFYCVQVALLHGALEQERSKVKGLQTEQPKHQVRVAVMLNSD